ncbi:Protein NEOXANTHIN-DEFICIENT 1 [Glycine max]|nr:Protein NEOXANTHIN-DEFICIENT 1 [Glycine max]
MVKFSFLSLCVTFIFYLNLYIVFFFFSFVPNLTTLLLSPYFHQFHIHSLHLGAKIHRHNFPYANLFQCVSDKFESLYFMEAVEAKSSSGAWYQLHLVKAEKARAYIPEEFKLVEAFG